MKLNLGCNQYKLEGWVNIDIDDEFKPDLIHDILVPLPYEANSVDEIYAGHLIEHIHYTEVVGVLLDWQRVLKEGGTLTLSFPDYKKCVIEHIEGRMTPFELGDILTGKGAHKQLMSTVILEGIAREIGYSEVEELADYEHLSGRAVWQSIMRLTK